MKCGYVPLWLVRDLPPLIGIAWSFWSLMIMVISSGRRAVLGKKISARVHDFIMHQHPIVEAHLRFALHRQAYRALAGTPRHQARPGRCHRPLVRGHELPRGLSSLDDGTARKRRLRPQRKQSPPPHPHPRRCERPRGIGSCPLRRAARATDPSLRLEHENHRRLFSSACLRTPPCA